jgi:branched-chain amino acid transport system permease protein
VLFFQVLVAGISTGAVYALVGLGYNIVFAGTHVFNLAQGQMLMLAVMVAWTLRDALSWPTVLAVVVAIAVAAVANVLVERVTVAPLRRRIGSADTKIDILASLVTTLGASIVITNLALVFWGPGTRAFKPYFPFHGIDVGRVTLTGQQFLMVGAALLVLLAYQAFTRRTRWGSALTAMAEDPGAAALRGVPVGRGSMLAFALGGIASGVAGAAIAPIAYASPSLGFDFGIKGFVAIAIGGFGSASGAVVGGLVVGIGESIGATYWNDQYRIFVDVILILIVLAVRPRGLLARRGMRLA